MTSSEPYGLAAAVIFAVSLYSVIVAPDLLRKLIALNVLGSAVFLLLVSLAPGPPGIGDPVPHAMVLTGIVVTVGITGLAVALLKRQLQASGRQRLPEDHGRPP